MSMMMNDDGWMDEGGCRLMVGFGESGPRDSWSVVGPE